MQSTSARWKAAVRGDHDVRFTVTHRNLVTGVQTVLAIDEDDGGSVVIDTTSNIRRTLSLTLPPQSALWIALDTPGGEITVTTSLVYSDGTTETLPQGVFIVDQDQIGYAPGDSITLTCPDRWLKVQRNKFGPSRSSVPSNTVWQEIKRLVEGAWPGSRYPFPGWAHVDQSATTKVGSLVYDDGDREGAIVQFLEDNSLEVFFDPNGLGVLQPIPNQTPATSTVATIDAGPGGVLMAADRTRDRSQTCNAVIVSTAATDVTFVPVQIVHQVAGDPYSVDGPLGYVPGEYSSPTLRNSQQGTAAGKTWLAKQLGTARTLSLEAAADYSLDGNDAVEVVLPLGDATSRPVEIHMLETVTLPLTRTATMPVSTRSIVSTADLTVVTGSGSGTVPGGGGGAGYTSWADVVADEQSWSDVVAEFGNWGDLDAAV